MNVTDEMVQRFLTWPVPAYVRPDGTPGFPGRTGTNLLDASTAKAMLQEVLGPVPHVDGTEGIIAPDPDRELSFGERAVGLRFNPAAKSEVYASKAAFAREIDRMNELRNASSDPEVERLASVAITEIEGAQMRSTKALTWS
jgi:hypothetical protein